MRRFAPSAFVFVALVTGGLTVTSSATAQPPASVDVRVAAASGTPKDLLATVPAVSPLRVGYKSGLFPSLASPAKDSRGCTLRNQMLIKLAAKKPKVLKGCKLVGGVWFADFGTKRLTKASMVKLGKLVPDVYAFGQGASSWNQEQRNAYTTVVPPAQASVGKAARSVASKLIPINLVPQPSTIMAVSAGGSTWLTSVNAKLAASPEVSQATLDALKAANPTLFQGWTIATMLNAKSWGLSIAPEIYKSMQVEFDACGKATVRFIDLSACTAVYTVPTESSSYKIIAVPETANTVPQVSEEILAGYGTPTGDTISRFMFGIHAPANWKSDVASGYDGGIDPDTIPTVPVGFLRLWDTETTWAQLEPTKGDWVWRKLDKQIQMAQQLDARVMLVLGMTPGWAGGSAQSMPDNIDDWRNYVSTVCRRYGASISSYEVWNEANLQTFWTGTAAQMADLTKAAFEEIRACNPSAQVIAANTTSRATGSFGTFFPQYLQEMKARNWPADGYSVHSYPTASGGADARITGIGQFRAALALAGAPFTAIYDTEINYGLEGLGDGHVTLAGDNAMTLMSRTYIDSARYGFGSTFWFVWTKQPDSKFGIQFTKDATAERLAWNTTYDWLVGARFQRCQITSDQVTVCQFSNGNGNFSIVWHGDVGSSPIVTKAGYFSGLGSRACSLKGVCEALTTSRALTVDSMPMRIDGAPLSDGPSTTTPTETTAPDAQVPDTPAGAPGIPSIQSVEVVYGASGKADGVATWAPTSSQPGSEATSYVYQWRSCTSGDCITIASGTTSATTFSASANLTEGPGTYYFYVAAQNAAGSSWFATKEFKVLTTKAAPPSRVRWWLQDGTISVNWKPPSIKPGLVKGYQVEFRNVTKNGKWITVDSLAKGAEASYPDGGDLIKVGETGIARVRTVLDSGATSPFIPSDEWTVASQNEPPRAVAISPTGDGPYFAMAWGLASAPRLYPEMGWQLQYSIAGGPWTYVKYSKAPGSTNPAVLPYAAEITFPLEASALTRWRMRTVSADGALPSAWVEANSIL